MQKNILILGLGAFGFAIAKHLGENNPELTIFASEINPEIYSSISETRKHPYFFEGVELPENIELIANTNDFLPEVDVIISIIPCQFVAGAFDVMKTELKDGVTILNLSKGIDNQSMQTVSEKLSEVLCSPQSSPREEEATNILPSHGEGLGERYNYTYAYLAGGMIAAELVEGKMLGADIVCDDFTIGSELQKLFLSDTLDINLKIGNVKNTELYAALKNIIALILGYHEGRGEGASSRGYYLSKLLEEMKGVIHLLDGNENIDFTDYALCGDLIATCFGGSRNRLLGNMLGEGRDISEVLNELKEQNKIAEGYETIKGVYQLTAGKAGFEEINTFGKKYIDIISTI